MKDKLEPNMYVRTKKGIAKIIDRILEPDHYYFKMWVTDKFLETNDDTEYISEVDVIKASYNIIDILEVGDAIEIDVIDEDNYPTIMGINFARIDNKVKLASIKDMLKNESAKLLTVITHEQMEQMAYKVGE